jgi:hypothetical protein
MCSLRFLWFRSLLRGGNRVDSFRQPRFIAFCCIAFDDALLNRSVDNTECFGQERFRVAGLTGRDRCAKLLQLCFEPMPVHLIDEAAALALSIPLQRGWMVCHVLSSYGFKNPYDNTCYNHPRF